MKIVHISDIHLQDAQILGTDPVAMFARCLAHVEAHHADADHVVITGDLVHRGEESAYRRLRAMLEASPLDVKLMLGNHDDRGVFLDVFPNSPIADGFVQWSEDSPAGRLIHLDTLKTGSHAGELGQTRLSWLERELESCERAILFMHHQPTPVGVADADIIGLLDQDAFAALLARHPGQVRHIFFGHCHYALSGAMDGIPFSAAQSTCHPNWPEIGGPAGRTGYSQQQSRSYAVALIDERSTVVHSIEFLLEDALTWLSF